MDAQLERELADWINAPDYHPVKPKSLAKRFRRKGSGRKRFDKALEELLEAGIIREDRKGRIAPRKSPGRIEGTVKKIASGDAFLIPESGSTRGKDVFIPAEHLHDAHTGDHVLVSLAGRRGTGGRRFGTVEEILERATTTFVGTYAQRGERGFVSVDADQFDRPVPVGDPGAKRAQPGDKVVIEMLRFPTHARAGEAVLVKVLGPEAAPEVDTLSIIHEFELPTEFPDDVLEEAASVTQSFDDADIGNRRDLTGETIVTIDPADARDFDDAISLARSDNGHWHLGVHIADVACLVKPGSALDIEARKRGTSAYLPGTVIPMLPEVISNGLASLQEGRLRFTKSVFIEFDAEFRVVHTEFADSAIEVAQRLVYGEVLPAIRDDPGAIELPPNVVDLLRRMHQLAMGLRQRRFDQGAIELDLAETKLELDRGGVVTGVSKVVHDESHQIIEEFMLAANQAVARAFVERELPLIRRVHAEPDEQKLQLFAEFVGTLGFSLKNFQSRLELQEIIRAVRDKPLEQAVNYALLRSFRQAEYSVAEEGHYALAMDDYCHFTSPIRRYPDLIVHRALSAIIGGRKRPKRLGVDVLDAIARRCSDLARRAEAAERELVKVKLLRFVADSVGEEINAVIVGVERFGVFCRGIETPIEGLLHITAIGGAIGEVIDFDETAHALVARTSGRRLQLGRPLRVRIARVDLPARKLEFVLPDDSGFSSPKPRGDSRAAPKPKKSSKKKHKAKSSKSGGRRKRAQAARQPNRRRRRG